MSSADKNSSEALFLKDKAKKENETQPKHSKANIVANIETNISISNNTEDVTYLDLLSLEGTITASKLTKI